MKWGKNGGGFDDLSVIAKVVSGKISWIFHGRGWESTTGSRDPINGVGCVRGRRWKVYFLDDSDSELTRVFVKVMKG